MEFHIEQVLYRDQRTIKTRYIDVSKFHRQKSCRFDQNDHLNSPFPSENQRFIPVSHHQGSSFSSGSFLSIEGGASPTSSLDNCHNQYSSKLKRLLQRTDSECLCENVNVSGITDRRKRRVTSWLKKFQNVLLLSTYLSLLTLPNTHALPAKMCNRPSASDEAFWMTPCAPDYEPSGEPPSELNVTGFDAVINSATSAMISARYLKEKFRNQTIDNTGADPEANYAGSKYGWLPNLPKVSNSEEFRQHLSSLKWQDSLLEIHRHLQTISVPLEQLILDFNQDSSEPLRGNFSEMKGRVTNIFCDLRDSLADNNLKVQKNVERDIMPSNLRNVCNNKTVRAVRDWIILREVVNVLEYTLAVCKYFASGTIEIDF